MPYGSKELNFWKYLLWPSKCWGIFWFPKWVFSLLTLLPSHLNSTHYSNMSDITCPSELELTRFQSNNLVNIVSHGRKHGILLFMLVKSRPHFSFFSNEKTSTTIIKMHFMLLNFIGSCFWKVWTDIKLGFSI